MKTLVVNEIKRSIEIMDEFVDEDYDLLELKNWFGVCDSKNRPFSMFDNAGRMQVSLIVSKEHDKSKGLCEYEPTMTEVRQMKHERCLFLDFPYPEGTMLKILCEACKVWEKDVFIPLETEICLRAQTSYNRMDYGCEWLGGGDWEEKTMYGETTDFFIVGVILHEPYKHFPQQAAEILAELKNQRDEIEYTFNAMIEVLKKTDEIVIQKVLGRPPREGHICECSGNKITVQFESASASFMFPDCYFKGFLTSPRYGELIAKAKEIYADLEERNKTIKVWQTAIDSNNLDKMFSLVWEYNGH